jgi:hypothetical protein
VLLIHKHGFTHRPQILAIDMKVSGFDAIIGYKHGYSIPVKVWVGLTKKMVSTSQKLNGFLTADERNMLRVAGSGKIHEAIIF